MTNNNVLKGVKCPKCGHEKDFIYRMMTDIYVEDDGMDIDEHNQFEFDDSVRVDCLGCRHEAPLHTFKKS